MNSAAKNTRPIMLLVTAFVGVVVTSPAIWAGWRGADKKYFADPRFETAAESIDGFTEEVMRASWQQSLDNHQPGTTYSLDPLTVYDLNMRATRAWTKLRACHASAQEARVAYYKGNLKCSQNKNLSKEFSSLRASASAFINSVTIPDTSFQNFVVQPKMGYYHPLFVQVLLEAMTHEEVYKILGDWDGLSPADLYNKLVFRESDRRLHGTRQRSQFDTEKINEGVPANPDLAALMEQMTPQRSVRTTAFIGTWAFRNTLILLILMPSVGLENWGLWPHISLAVMQSFRMHIPDALVSAAMSLDPHGFTLGTGDIREIAFYDFNTVYKRAQGSLPLEWDERWNTWDRYVKEFRKMFRAGLDN